MGSSIYSMFNSEVILLAYNYTVHQFTFYIQGRIKDVYFPFFFGGGGGGGEGRKRLITRAHTSRARSHLRPGSWEF